MAHRALETNSLKAKLTTAGRAATFDCPLIYWILATEEAKWMIIEAARFLGVSVRVKA